jgi:catechol 2,3-dioxygenase-like lactoylglutathione lyase family enzyme
MFPLGEATRLGLWSRHTVAPPATAPGGSGEIAFTMPDAEGIRRTHDAWTDRGIPIAQPPTEMDFGHSFVALDPDGHRLRVFAPVAP